jgi:hypothetical protein
MKKITLLVTIAIACLSGNAENGNLEKLIAVNAEWKSQQFSTELVNQLSSKNLLTFNDWIAAHLMLVESTLKKRDISHLTAAQKNNRIHLLQKLNAYWKAEIFPINDYLTFKNPVFIDRIGTHCAVGYLMQQSGNDKLAQEIDANEKFAYIKEIKTKGVTAWAVTNGFTLDELAWIQPGYPPAFTLTDLAGGLNGAVNAMAIDPSHGTLYVGGNFTNSTEGVECNHISAYLSGFAGWLWAPLGQGVNGNVHAMLIYNNKLYVGGEFTSADGISVNNIAAYNLQGGQWESVGNLDGTVKALAIYNNELYAGGSFTGFLSKLNGNNWIDVGAGFLYGTEVRTLEANSGKLYIGGDFELATGALRRNVAIYDGTYVALSGMGTVTPVNDFETYNGKLYAACDYISATNDTCALAVWDEMEWKTIIGRNYLVSSGAFLSGDIKKLLTNGNEMLASGNFLCFVGMINGNNLMSYRESAQDTMITPLLVTDSTINCMTFIYSNTLCIGGDFVGPQGDPLNHIASIDITTGINKQFLNHSELKVYPNPSSDFVNVEAESNLGTINLFDVTGKLVYQSFANGNKSQLPIKELSKGVYFLKSEKHIEKIIKQ